ncbi:MAG: GTP cyclohydrolase I [Mollicutes bacterium]|nr:GTP cyclohydrolase I [Mollicutes bacterium]
MEACVKEFLSIVDDPERPGLVETPKRVVKYWTELLEGQLYTNKEIADMYNKCFDLDEDDVENVPVNDAFGVGQDLVIETNIPIFSHCEHHLALMYDMYVTIAYIPRKTVIGLSKMGRIAEMVGKRLQLQEKIGEDINEIMRDILDTDDVAVIIEGKHGCMTARGVKAREAITRTACLKGRFQTNPALRSELYSLIKKNH